MTTKQIPTKITNKKEALDFVEQLKKLKEEMEERKRINKVFEDIKSQETK